MTSDKHTTNALPSSKEACFPVNVRDREQLGDWLDLQLRFLEARFADFVTPNSLKRDLRSQNGSQR